VPYVENMWVGVNSNMNISNISIVPNVGRQHFNCGLFLRQLEYVRKEIMVAELYV